MTTIKSIAIVTGANSGMGFVTTQSLALKGYHVVMVCRNEQKANAAKDVILNEQPDASLDVIIGDLSDIRAVQKITSKIVQQYDKIDVLVNNAGLYISERKTSVDGFELTFANNHLGYFLMAQGLIPLLEKSKEPRIVNVASEANQYGKLDWENIQLEKGFSAILAYSNSKLYNILFTFELAKRLANKKITVNCMHPGGVNTNFAIGAKGIAGFIFGKLGWLLRTPQKGAETIIWLASSNELKDVTGKYFCDKKEIKAKKIAYDESACKKFWEYTENCIKTSINH
jgi:NAD(P)-dependent dehydrogenase (short-subunit alcohol dehydrogenase family)